MRTILRKITLLLLLALFVPGIQPASSAKSGKGRKKQASESPAPKKLSAYEKLFDKKQVTTVNGLLRLHLVEGKLYTEIPVALLGREFIITTTIEESSLSDYGLAGQQPQEPYRIAFTKTDSLIQLREIPMRIVTDGDPNMERAIKRNTTSPIVANYPIKAYNADSTAVVIENTSLFTGGNKYLEAFEPRGMSMLHMSTATPKAELSVLRTIRAGKDYASVVSDMTYGVTTQYFIFIVCKDKPFTAVANRTITLLPEQCAPERMADPRAGVVPIPCVKYTADHGSKPVYMASRINFRRNGKIEPKTVYVDTLFAPVWQRGVRRGIELWNAAFREIGMGDVLRVENYPAGAFDSNRPDGFYVKYVAAASSRVTVNQTTDPRSGEIMGGRIHLPENLTDEIRSQRFINLAAVDPAARDMRLDDQELASSIALYTARGMGQVLGLATNYAGAAAYPTDSLRSASFTSKYGLCSSITSPNNYNYLAQPEDKGVRLVNDCLGPYDYFTIRWLYGDVDASTPEAESKRLSDLLREKADDPNYYYGNFWYDYYFGDVRLAYNNLGSDPVKRLEYRFRNLQYIAEHADEWLAGRDFDGSYRDEVIAALANGVTEMISYMVFYVGGTYYTEVGEGDGQTMLRPVPRQEQRRYVNETLDVLENLSWLNTKISEGRMVNLAQSVQSSAIMSLLKRLEGLSRYQAGLPGAYTPSEMSSDLAERIFRDVKAGRKLSEANKQLQMSLAGVVIGSSKVTAQPKSAKGAAAAFGGESMLIQPVFPREARMTLEPIEAYGKYRQTYRPQEFSEHLYFGMLQQIRDIYKQGVAVATDASSRDFCRYMLNRIETSMEVK